MALAKSELKNIHKISFRTPLQEVAWFGLAMLYPIWGLLMPILVFAPSAASFPIDLRLFALIGYGMLGAITLHLRSMSATFRLGKADEKPNDVVLELTPVLTALTVKQDPRTGKEFLLMTLTHFQGNSKTCQFALRGLSSADATLLVSLLSKPEAAAVCSSEARKRLSQIRSKEISKLSEHIRYIPEPISQKIRLGPGLALPILAGWWRALSIFATAAVVPMPLAGLCGVLYAIALAANAPFWLSQQASLLQTVSSYLYAPPIALALIILGAAVPSGAAIGGAFWISHNYYVQVAAISIFLLLAVKVLKILASPTEIQVDDTGLRVLRRLWNYRTTLSAIQWQNLAAIKCVHPESVTDPALWQIALLAKDGSQVSIDLGGLMNSASKEALLKAFEKYAPQVERDADVYTSLHAGENQTYTDLWLSALTQPPQREKLLPLERGLVLKGGDYTVAAMHASGGQGLVYLANRSEESGDDESHNLIIKEAMLPLYVSEEARRKAVERFDRDARLLSQLDSPHIAKVVDYFIEDHRSYLVTERIFGQDLRTCVEEDGPMTASAILELLPQMLAGLKYIHSRTPAVVHHDFTPDNLICSTSGQLVLIDFDVAREQSTRTLATMVGKQAYTPPEQLRGQAGPASDIYALGATLYFLASGENPRPISRNSLPSARQDSPQWRILDEIISGCTILDTSNRFTIEDIERVLGRNSATAIAAAAKSSEKERSQIGDEDDDESEESRDNVAKILVRMEQKEEV